MAGVSPAAPYRHFRDRDELLSSIAQRGFEQFEALLTQAWDDGRPDTVTAFERVGKAYLAFAREEPAFYSAMFESGLPVDLNPTLLAASERAFGIIRAAAERLAALAPPGVPRPPAMMMALHIWSMSHGVASLFGRGDAARRKLPMSPEDLLEAAGADLSARSRLPDRPPAAEPKDPAEKPAAPPPARRHQVLGAPRKNKFGGAAGARLDKNPGWFTYVNVIYIHNGVMPSWRGKWPTPQMSIAGAAPHEEALPPAYARFAVASRLDRRDRARLHHLVADRTCPSLFHTREQKNGLLEQSGSLCEQDGADAVQDGADARPHGAPRLRLRRPALQRQPRLRRIPRRNAAAPRGRAGRVQGISSIACATPRTRKSSTSSWRSTSSARPRRTISRRAERQG